MAEDDRETRDTDDDRLGPVGASAPMDMMLSEAGSSVGRWLPGRSGLRFAAALARRPAPVARLARHTVGELARVTLGRSQVVPDRKDRRFADPAWTDMWDAQFATVAGRSAARVARTVGRRDGSSEGL